VGETVQLVLASRSPRRIELLSQLGLTAQVIPADIDETPLPRENPVAYVERLARAKANAVFARVDSASTVLAADTTVDLDGQIFGQPVDEADARRMIKLLSGRTHRVHTAVAVVRAGDEAATVVTSLVTFVAVTDALLDWYLGTGESSGKAGSYAIQGHGAVLVESVRGSTSNVVGLPLRETAALLGLGSTNAD
jgi:septum formation protein